MLDHLDDPKLNYQHFLLAAVAILDMDAIESKEARGRGVVAKLLALVTKLKTLDVPDRHTRKKGGVGRFPRRWW